MNSLHEHLQQRHMDIDLHRPVIDEENRVATFFLYNLSGQIVGYQQYRPDADKKPQNNPKEGRYYTYRKQPTVAVFGVESLHLSPCVVFLTEGIFDAARLTEKKCSALAVLSNDPSNDLKNFLFFLGRKVIAVCDNDVAGKKLAKFADEAIFTEDKDLGDSDQKFVDDLVKKYVKG